MTKKVQNPFQQLTAFLTSQDIQHAVKEASDEIPFEMAIIPLQEKESQSHFLEIHQYTHDAEDSKKLFILNFILKNHLPIPEKQILNILKFSMHVNRSIPLGGIFYSDVEKCCYYQYGYPATTEIIQNDTFKIILNSSLVAKDVFFKSIQAIIEETATVDSLIQAEKMV